MSHIKSLHFPPPFEQQKEFLRAKERFVAYGGSRGGGKSFAVRLKASLSALHYPGIRILILRRSYPELYENHIKALRRMLDGVAEYRDTDKSLTFKNLSLIKFGYCDTEADAERYQGQEYDLIFMDEATHFTEYQFLCLSACLRGTGDYPRRFYLTCNPGGVGHAWVKRLFIDRDFRPGEEPGNYRFIRASVYDNLPLLEKDPSYLSRLRALTPEMRKAWLDGDWDILAGRFFPELKEELHLTEASAPPPGARVFRAFDYGLDMLACLWFSLDDRGNILVFRELALPGLIVSAAARAIREHSPEEVVATYAPPDLSNRQKDTGCSMWELFEAGGIRLTRADSNRVQGWMQVREALSPRPRGNGESAPRLTISRACPGLWRCLGQLRHDKERPGDCLTAPHEFTHLPDALRYFLRSRATPPREKRETEEESPVAAYFMRRMGKERKGRFN